LVEVEVTAGTLREAQLKSKAVNHDHGLRRSSEDIHKAIKDMLFDDEWSKWSLGEIAKWIGTSKTTIHRVKGMLELKTGKPAEEKQSTKYTRGEDGHEVSVDLSHIAKVNEQKRAERPVGTKPDNTNIDETKLENQMLNDKISELSEVVSSLSDENARLKDVIATAQWDASDIEKMDIEDTVKELRSQIRQLEIDNRALTDSRDSYQNKVSELIRVNKSLQSKLKNLTTD
jgi:exonuclease VII small subunit